MQICQVKCLCHVMQICQANVYIMPHHANLSIRWNHDRSPTTYYVGCKFYVSTFMTLWRMQSCAQQKICLRQCYLFWMLVPCQRRDVFTPDSKIPEWRITWRICRMLDNFLNLCLHFYIMHYMSYLNVVFACLHLYHVIIYLILHIYA